MVELCSAEIEDTGVSIMMVKCVCTSGINGSVNVHKTGYGDDCGRRDDILGTLRSNNADVTEADRN